MDPANPTQVNPFNGLSNDSAAADHFGKLYDQGAFNPDGKPDAAQGQTAPDSVAPAADPLPPGKAAADPKADDAPEYSNLDEYLGKAGLERDSFYSLPVRVKDQDLPLSEVLKRAEAHQDVEASRAALAHLQKEWETQRTAQQTQLSTQLQQAKSLGDLAANELMAEFKAVNWQELRQFNGGEYAAKQQDFQNRWATIQTHLQNITQAQQAEQQKATQTLQANLKVERENLLKAVPEWRDETKFKSAQDLMTKYARDRGFKDEELNAIYDHRYMQVLHDAAQWRALQGQQSAALKKVRAAPQISAPGARISRDPKAASASAAKDLFMKTRGSKQDPAIQANYFEHLAQ